MQRRYSVELEVRVPKRRARNRFARWRLVTLAVWAYSASDAGYQARLEVRRVEHVRSRLLAVRPAPLDS